MKIYNITKGQLITIWVFGILVTFACLVNLDSYDPQVWSSIGVFLVPGLLVFYTLGWKHYRKIKQESSEIVSPRLKAGIKRFMPKIIGFSITIIVIAVALAYFPFSNNSNKRNGDVTESVNTVRKANIQSYWWAFATTTPNQSLTLSTVEFTNLGNIVSNDFGYSFYNKLETSGKFVKAVFTITNITNTSLPFKIDQLGLKDEKDRSLESIKMFHCNNPLQDYAGPYDTASYYSFQLKPGIPCRVAVLFEVPADSQSALLGIALRTGIDVYTTR